MPPTTTTTSATAPNLATLTPSQLALIEAAANARWNPPWSIALAAILLLLLVLNVVARLLEARFALRLRIPNRFFTWTPGRAAFEAKLEELERARREGRGEGLDLRSPRTPRVFGEQRGGGERDGDGRMLGPRERGEGGIRMLSPGERQRVWRLDR